MTIYTIGYEGATMDGFIAALRETGVRRVIDVRALPLSRRPGFSKSTLAASLKAEGIDYVHLKALGTPKPGRDAAKKGDVATLTAIYDAQLELTRGADRGGAYARPCRRAAQCVAVLRTRSVPLPPHPAAGRGGRRARGG